MKRILIAVFCLAAVMLLNTAFAAERLLSERKDVQQFIQQMVDKHQFDRKQLTQWLNQASINQKIIDSISKPAEGLPWFKYKKIFITPSRIESGVAFWKEHQDTLKKASAEYGVPEEVIVAILGVETFYGKHAGGHRVIDALVTLGFDYPPRSKFFLSELEEFLLLTREEKWDPMTIKGSYAGAMGKPQFISSSYRRYAVDFNKTGRRDLLNSSEDSIGSVANYFKVHGWKKNQPIIFPAAVKGEQFKSLITNLRAPKPTYSYNEIAGAGVGLGLGAGMNVNTSLKGEKFALVSMEGENGLEHWLGLENFYVITRYNHSSLYAMAVYELSQNIKSAYNKERGMATKAAAKAS
ncbi:lytic murein transglycosylase B [Candidatus Berkiella cookevillensis]|uniref:Lytic murein transglycosylase B n=1 Tax=Candidatus Berkiella cookevillensis TaxID=437022 RepID=A0A0Q9YDD8_9GAMM|nr:lytic murein transglycosylase B [Candidatus Berkiella cookevillensis]MCS5707872.1 lytic murein transglycosylase B [Candidatus Berkiella cookevillensis]